MDGVERGEMMDAKSILNKTKKILKNDTTKDDKLQKISDLLKCKVSYYDWVGFYLVEKGRLVLGPFSGEPTEHTKIDFGEGICGQAAETEENFVVQDVSQETNYLSCSPKVKSEIVIPILKDGKVIGELDIDSHETSPFTIEDEKMLGKICDEVADVL
ncbi:MAG: GAF domain-containing protein [Thermoplasmatota archaeon]